MMLHKYRVMRWDRKVTSKPEEGYDIIPEKKTDMLSSGYSRMMYNIIEDDFNKFLNYIPLEEELLDVVYSPRLADIIMRLGREIENFFKEWLDSSYSNKYPKVDLYRTLTPIE